MSDRAIDSKNPPDTRGVPRAPSDRTTLIEVLHRLEADGFDGQIEVGEDASLSCIACGFVGRPEHFAMHSVRRLEGASDPDDMLAVVGLECQHCQRRAAVMLQYGPNAPSEHGEVMAGVRDIRDRDPGAHDMGPGEADDAGDPDDGDAADSAASMPQAMRDADVANGEGPGETGDTAAPSNAARPKADRAPTADEERAAERAAADVDIESVAAEYQHMQDIGVAVRGEGEIPG